MRELRIGDLARLTQRTTEHIRRFERAGRIPKAHRDEEDGWRYWTQADLPAICAGLGVAPPPDPLDSLLAAFEGFAPVIAQAVEKLLGGKTLAQAMGELVRR
jgi:hypothetical protein